jgi:hypothetical protein
VVFAEGAVLGFQLVDTDQFPPLVEPPSHVKVAAGAVEANANANRKTHSPLNRNRGKNKALGNEMGIKAKGLVKLGLKDPHINFSLDYF